MLSTPKTATATARSRMSLRVRFAVKSAPKPIMKKVSHNLRPLGLWSGPGDQNVPRAESTDAVCIYAETVPGFNQDGYLRTWKRLERSSVQIGKPSGIRGVVPAAIRDGWEANVDASATSTQSDSERPVFSSGMA